MDDNDSLDQAFADLIVPSTLTIADEDRAYRSIVDRAHRRITHRRLTTSAVAMALVAAIVITSVITSQPSTSEVRVQDDPTSSTTTTSTKSLPPMDGMETVSDGTHDVGYVPSALVHPKSIAAIEATNARTMFPVTNAQGTLVGYLALGLPFIPLAEAQQPGFDVEAVRAKSNGGCEPQLGDPTFKQKFPRCPPLPVEEPPPGSETTTTVG
jgi:hypothetical protein